MVIIRKKNANLIVFLFLIIIILFNFIIFKDRLKEFSKDEIISYIGYTNYGFSNRWNLVDGELFEEYSKTKVVIKIIKSLPKIIKYKLTDKNFEKLNIEIPFQNWEILIKDKIEAQNNFGLLVNPQFINGKISYKGKDYEAKIRLKGAGSHFSSSRQMSLRIHLKNNETIFGYNRFSIHKIEERQFLVITCFKKFKKLAI